jgi:hypothetical protein
MKLFPVLLTLIIATTALPAQQPASISGRLLGCNGSPMLMAHVQIHRPNQTRPMATVQTDDEGYFTATTPEEGLLMVKFSGVSHQSLTLPMVVGSGDGIGIEVQLKAREYPRTFDSIGIIGDFNSFNFTAPERMELRDDSTFVIRFHTTAPELAYQLLAGTVPITGTDADGYVFDDMGNYRAIVKNTDDQVRVVFDPRLLMRSNAEALVMWSDSTRIEFARIYNDIQNHRRSYEQALMDHRAAGGTIAGFSYDWSRTLKHLAQRIESESDSLLRQALLISYLDLMTCDATKQLNQELIRQALDEIPPSSPLWAVNPRLVPLAVERTGDSALQAEYTQRVIEENRDPIVQAILLYDGLVVAHRNNEAERARRYYDRLVNEFGHTPYAGMARVEFAMQ